MSKHRSDPIELERHVARECLAGEALHRVAKRHEVSRNLMRIRVAKYEAGAFDSDVVAAGPSQMPKAFYINLDRHPERRSHIEAQLRGIGIDAERVQGVDGRNLPPDLAGYFDLDSSSERALTAGQIGCHASHLRIMRLIADRGLPCAMVLEDDAVFGADLPVAIDQVLRSLPDGWDIVRLCRASKRSSRPLVPLSCGRSLVRYSRVPVGRAGYLVSRQGAQKLLAPRQMQHPGDVEITRAWQLGLDVFGVEPNPVTQERDAMKSTIGGDRGRAMHFTGYIIPDPRRLIFNVRKLGPYWWTRCLLQNIWMRVAKLLPFRKSLEPVGAGRLMAGQTDS